VKRTPRRVPAVPKRLSANLIGRKFAHRAGFVIYAWRFGILETRFQLLSFSYSQPSFGILSRGNRTFNFVKNNFKAPAYDLMNPTLFPYCNASGCLTGLFNANLY
jgi:hypothetical protein